MNRRPGAESSPPLDIVASFLRLHDEERRHLITQVATAWIRSTVVASSSSCAPRNSDPVHSVVALLHACLGSAARLSAFDSGITSTLIAALCDRPWQQHAARTAARYFELNPKTSFMDAATSLVLSTSPPSTASTLVNGILCVVKHEASGALAERLLQRCCLELVESALDPRGVALRLNLIDGCKPCLKTSPYRESFERAFCVES